MIIKDIKLNPEEAKTLANELQLQLNRGEIPKADQKNIDILIAGLAEKRGLLRRVFAQSLGKVGKAAVPSLQKALIENKNVIVRRAAAKTLKLVGDPKALPYLLEALVNDEDKVVQCSAVGAMAIFGAQSVKHLLKIIEDPNSSVIQSGLASWALAFVGTKAPEAIKDAAKSANSLIRAAAIGALADQIKAGDDEEAGNLLMKAINDTCINVQIEAIRVIGNIPKNPAIESELIKKLIHKNAEIRKTSALSLLKLNCKKSLNELNIIASKEKNDDVKKVLLFTINKIRENRKLDL